MYILHAQDSILFCLWSQVLSLLRPGQKFPINRIQIFIFYFFDWQHDSNPQPLGCNGEHLQLCHRLLPKPYFLTGHLVLFQIFSMFPEVSYTVLKPYFLMGHLIFEHWKMPTVSKFGLEYAVGDFIWCYQNCYNERWILKMMKLK